KHHLLSMAGRRIHAILWPAPAAPRRVLSGRAHELCTPIPELSRTARAFRSADERIRTLQRWGSLHGSHRRQPDISHLLLRRRRDCAGVGLVAERKVE